MRSSLLAFIAFFVALSAICQVGALQHDQAVQQEDDDVISLSEAVDGLYLAADAVSEDLKIYAQLKDQYGDNLALDEADVIEIIGSVLKSDDVYPKLLTEEMKLSYMRLAIAAKAVALAKENLRRLPLARQLFFITKESKALDQRQMELRQAYKSLKKIKGLKPGQYEEIVAMGHQYSNPSTGSTIHGRLQEKAPGFILPIAATALVATFAMIVIGVFVRQNKL